MIALPLISSVIAPSSLMAQSDTGLLPLFSACSQNSECQSNNCVGTQGGTRNCCSTSTTGSNPLNGFFMPGQIINDNPGSGAVCFFAPTGSSCPADSADTCCSGNGVVVSGSGIGCNIAIGTQACQCV